MRAIALQSAVGGMGLSVIGMFVAITQELIDVLAVLNALRASIAPRLLSDSEPQPEVNLRSEQ